MSSAQERAVGEVGDALSRILETIPATAHGSRTVVIVTADHGGHLQDHGDETCVDRVIPWLAWGDGIRKGYEIQRQVKTYDTAVTALWLLGLRAPAALEGRAIDEIRSPEPARGLAAGPR